MWFWWSGSLARHTTKRSTDLNNQIHLFTTHFSCQLTEPFHSNPQSIKVPWSIAWFGSKNYERSLTSQAITQVISNPPTASSKACIIPISPTFAQTWRGKQRWFGGNPFLEREADVGKATTQPVHPIPRKTVIYLRRFGSSGPYERCYFRANKL